VTLRAAWSLKSPDSQSWRGTEEVRIPAGTDCAGAATLPAVMSQALAQLGDRIAAVIAHSAAGSPSQDTADHDH
jgi:hypothetical protein